MGTESNTRPAVTTTTRRRIVRDTFGEYRPTDSACMGAGGRGVPQRVPPLPQRSSEGAPPGVVEADPPTGGPEADAPIEGPQQTCEAAPLTSRRSPVCLFLMEVLLD